MIEPETCGHAQACRTLDLIAGKTKVYGYGCRDCGLKVTAGTWEDARVLFGLRAEKMTVRRLIERRTAGEPLAEHERLMIGHSPFGDAHSHNF